MCAASYTIPPYLIGGVQVSHTIRDKAKLLARVRRIRGEVEALERALEAGKGHPRASELLARLKAA